MADKKKCNQRQQTLRQIKINWNSEREHGNNIDESGYLIFIQDHI